MGVNRITGKEILVQEIKRLNGGNIKQEAIDEVFNNLKDENGGNVKFDDFSNKLCTLYSLDENDEDFKKYLTEISNFDNNADNFSIEDLDAEFDYAPAGTSETPAAETPEAAETPKEPEITPMTPNAAHHSQTSTTATSDKAKDAVIGMDANNNPTSVTLNNGTVFDISNDLIKDAPSETSGSYNVYNIEDKGVTVKDGYWPDTGTILSRVITAPDDTTLYIYYNKTGEINGIFVDDYMEENGGKIYSYNSQKKSSNQSFTPSAGNNTTSVDTTSAANTTANTNNENKDNQANITNLLDEQGNTIGTQETNGNITINRYNEGKTVVTMNGKDIEIAYEKDGVFYYSQAADGNWSHKIEQDEDGNWQYIEIKSEKETIPQSLSIDGNYFNALTKDSPEYAQSLQTKANEIADAKKPEKEIKKLLKSNDINAVEKMAVLELLNDEYSDEIQSAMATNDIMLKNGLEELLKSYDVNTGSLPIESIITFENYYMELQKDDSITDKIKEKVYVDIYLQIYERAAENEDSEQKFKDIDNANNSLHYSIPELAVLIQQKYSKSDETTRLKKLVNATGYDEQIEQAKQNPLGNADTLKEKYLTGSNNKETLKTILDGVIAAENGKDGLKYEEAIYLLSQVEGLDSARGLIEKNFRELEKDEQEKYITSLFNTLAYRNDTVKATAGEVKEAKVQQNSENKIDYYTSAPGDDVYIRACIVADELTPDDRIKVLKWQKANQAFDSQVSEILKGYSGEPLVSDVKSIASKNNSSLEDIKNYLEEYNKIADIEEPYQYYSSYDSMTGYTDMMISIFNYKKDEFTKDNIEEYNKIFGTNDFMQTLKINYGYVSTDNVAEYLKALNSVESACGISAKEPSQDMTDTYLINDTPEKNVNYILYNWQCGNIDDDIAKALLMKAANS